MGNHSNLLQYVYIIPVASWNLRNDIFKICLSCLKMRQIYVMVVKIKIRERERVTVYIITINALDLIKSVPYLHHP